MSVLTHGLRHFLAHFVLKLLAFCLSDLSTQCYSLFCLAIEHHVLIFDFFRVEIVVFGGFFSFFFRRVDLIKLLLQRFLLCEHFIKASFRHHFAFCRFLRLWGRFFRCFFGFFYLLFGSCFGFFGFIFGHVLFGIFGFRFFFRFFDFSDSGFLFDNGFWGLFLRKT